MHPPDVTAEPPRRSARVRAAVSGTVVLVLVGFAAAVVASIVTPGGERVAVGQTPAAGSWADGDGGGAGGSARAEAAAGAQGEGAEGGPPAEGPSVIVHVTGAVAHPGVVELPAGARVIDVVARAGGASNDAELSAVNLAREVVDGEQIHVPRVDEPAPEGASAGSLSSSTGAGGPAAGGVLNLNTASSTELESLPGVGPALAGRIIAWREQNGPFRSVDELLAVSGIGEKTLSGFRELVGV